MYEQHEHIIYSTLKRFAAHNESLMIELLCPMQALHCENEFMAVQWLKMEEDLLRERGLFGPGPGVFIKQGWVQDAAEGPNRTRFRIRRKAARRSKKVRGH